MPTESSDDGSQSTLRVELHCHTHHSPDSLLRPQKLLEIAAARRLDKVAVTDHNTIDGARAAAALAPDRIIIGEEIMTTEGELLGYFLTDSVPAGQAPLEAIDQLRAQGAVISVSHPFDSVRKGAWAPAALDRILPHVDAIEVYNARAFSNGPNREAAARARQAGLPGTAGSDAHAGIEVGRTVMRLAPFNDAPGFLAALENGTVEGRLSSPLVHFLSRYAVWRKTLGWSP